jgi:hypothetical protein
VDKVALRFGCAKQSKNLEWYLLFMLHMEWSINYKNYNAKEIAYIVVAKGPSIYYVSIVLDFF